MQSFASSSFSEIEYFFFYSPLQSDKSTITNLVQVNVFMSLKRYTL